MDVFLVVLRVLALRPFVCLAVTIIIVIFSDIWRKIITALVLRFVPRVITYIQFVVYFIEVKLCCRHRVAAIQPFTFAQFRALEVHFQFYFLECVRHWSSLKIVGKNKKSGAFCYRPADHLYNRFLVDVAHALGGQFTAAVLCGEGFRGFDGTPADLGPVFDAYSRYVMARTRLVASLPADLFSVLREIRELETDTAQTYLRYSGLQDNPLPAGSIITPGRQSSDGYSEVELVTLSPEMRRDLDASL